MILIENERKGWQYRERDWYDHLDVYLKNDFYDIDIDLTFPKEENIIYWLILGEGVKLKNNEIRGKSRSYNNLANDIYARMINPPFSKTEIKYAMEIARKRIKQHADYRDKV